MQKHHYFWWLVLKNFGQIGAVPSKGIFSSFLEPDSLEEIEKIKQNGN